MTAPSATTDHAAESLGSPVRSHNEWDPLEEIVVGRLDGATIPASHPVVACNIPRGRPGCRGWPPASSTPGG